MDNSISFIKKCGNKVFSEMAGYEVNLPFKAASEREIPECISERTSRHSFQASEADKYVFPICRKCSVSEHPYRHKVEQEVSDIPQPQNHYRHDCRVCSSFQVH